MSSEKNALLSDSDNSNDQFDSEISDEDRQGNTKPSDNESNSESEGDTQETEQVEYEQVELDPDTVNITIEELEDEDVELWLVRIPRHRTLTDDLVGAKFRMALDSEKGLDRLAGGLKGSYHFRDQGSAPDKNLRATFVVPTADGDGKLHVAKPFTKSVSVTFDTHLTKLTDSTPAPRVYPRRPENLQQKYFAIGSSKRARSPPPVLKTEILDEDSPTPVKRPRSSKKERTGRSVTRPKKHLDPSELRGSTRLTQ